MNNQIGAAMSTVFGVVVNELTPEGRKRAGGALGELAADTTDPQVRQFYEAMAAQLADRIPPGTIADITVHIGETGRSHFDCPNCGRAVRYTNTFPLSFNWKTCPGCGWLWTPVRDEGIGPMKTELLGQTATLTVHSLGKP